MIAESLRRNTSQLPNYLDDIIFPASRMEILRCAEDNEAPDILLDAIERLPELRYWSVREILAKISGHA